MLNHSKLVRSYKNVTEQIDYFIYDVFFFVGNIMLLHGTWPLLKRTSYYEDQSS